MSQQKPNRTSDDTYKRRLFYDNGIRFVEVNGRMTGEYNPPTPILKVAANVNIQSSSSFINKISIHPMLRFNWEKILGIYPKARFQYILCYGSTCSFLISYSSLLQFQYILCYGSTSIESKLSFLDKSISIHPMLRFNYVTIITNRYISVISIHPMLRFNRHHNIFLALTNQISIHPMLRFNRKKL